VLPLLLTALGAALAAHALVSPTSPLRRLGARVLGGAHTAAARIAGGQCPVIRRKEVEESEEEEEE
jgi:hypothetical protein